MPRIVASRGVRRPKPAERRNAGSRLRGFARATARHPLYPQIILKPPLDLDARSQSPGIEDLAALPGPRLA